RRSSDLWFLGKGYLFSDSRSAVVSGSAVRAICQFRAPRERRNSLTVSGATGVGGAHESRRTVSGSNRFSLGITTFSAIPVTVERADSKRRAASGARSAQRFTGGGPLPGGLGRGRSGCP